MALDVPAVKPSWIQFGPIFHSLACMGPNFEFPLDPCWARAGVFGPKLGQDRCVWTHAGPGQVCLLGSISVGKFKMTP